jgi:nucleoside-diphosphate-sugar epimerase
VKARSRTDFFETNGRGAGRVAEAAARAGARGLLVSSLVAREPGLSGYAASKAAGEAASRAALGADLTIVRPPAIYGPGDRATLDLFWAAARSPLLPVPDRPQARLALAYVDDVCATISALARAPSEPGPYEIGGARPDGYSWAEIATALSEAGGRRQPVVPSPAWLLLAAGAAAGGVSRVTGSPSMLTLGKAREILHPDWSVAPANEPRAVNRTAVDLNTGFRRTLEWYRNNGWIN